MTIKVTEQERKELESIRELIKSDDIEMYRLAMNLLKRYERFNKYYTYLYRRKINLFGNNKYQDVTEFYLNDWTEEHSDEYCGIIHIDHYFTDLLDTFRYRDIVRDLLFKAIIDERDIFWNNGN